MAFPSPGSPSSGQLQIGIALVLQDRFSNQAREASSQIRRLHQEAKAVTNANLQTVRNITGMGAAIGAGALAGMAGIVQEGANFIDTMTFVDAIATKSGITMEQLGYKAKALGADTMFMARDVASAMQYFAMAGMATDEIYQNIEAAVNLAGATMSSLGGKGGTADILTNIMRMFQITSSELNSNRVADVLTTGVTSSNTNLYDLAEAIKYAGTTVKNLGGSIEQTTAFIGVLGDAGIQGSMAGTAMANAYRYLTRSVEDANFKGGKALRALGLSKEDFITANGQLIDLGLAMQKISKAMSGMSDTEKFNQLVAILGVRGERGGSTMMKAFERYTELLDKVQNQSQGKAAGIMSKRMMNLAGTLNIMVSALENVRIAFAESLEPVLAPIFSTLGSIFNVVRKILATPYLGPLIATTIAFGTLLVTVKLGVLALRSSMKLMFNDSTISFANMVAVMKQGWTAASISASQYKAIQEGILAQQKAGIVSNTIGASMFSGVAGMSYITQNAGKRAGGIFFKNGRYYEQTGKGATGVTRITEKAAAAKLAGKSMSELGLSKGGAIGAALGLSGRGVLGGIGRALSIGLRFLGGPIGLGITAISLLLPAIIQGISNSSSSRDANTAALNRNTDYKNAELAKKTNPLTDEEQRLVIANALNNLAQTLMNRPTGVINIYTPDGTLQSQQVILDGQNDDIHIVGAK